MNDTPDHVRRLYADFIMGKSDAERFKMGFDMADVGQHMVEQRCLDQYPDLSVGEIKAAVFERIYRTDFSLDEMGRIKAELIAFYQKNNHSSLRKA